MPRFCIDWKGREPDLTTVEYEKRGHIAYVTLNRPDKLNAMNAAMHRELGEVWQDFQMDPEMRAAVLSGNGRCFSAGADLSGGAPDTYRYTGDFPDISRTRKVYKPIVSALHSHVVGYGMWIALDADLRVATPDTSFWLPETAMGHRHHPGRLVPEDHALGDCGIALAEPIAVGLINKIVPQEG